MKREKKHSPNRKTGVNTLEKDSPRKNNKGGKSKPVEEKIEQFITHLAEASSPGSLAHQKLKEFLDAERKNNFNATHEKAYTFGNILQNLFPKKEARAFSGRFRKLHGETRSYLDQSDYRAKTLTHKNKKTQKNNLASDFKEIIINWFNLKRMSYHEFVAQLNIALEKTHHSKLSIFLEEAQAWEIHQQEIKIIKFFSTLSQKLNSQYSHANKILQKKLTEEKQNNFKLASESPHAIPNILQQLFTEQQPAIHFKRLSREAVDKGKQLNKNSKEILTEWLSGKKIPYHEFITQLNMILNDIRQPEIKCALATTRAWAKYKQKTAQAKKSKKPTRSKTSCSAKTTLKTTPPNNLQNQSNLKETPTTLPPKKTTIPNPQDIIDESTNQPFNDNAIHETTETITKTINKIDDLKPGSNTQTKDKQENDDTIEKDAIPSNTPQY